jgi:murein DD-endopeptidase MepM/ murein hydrolase activator NlpD
MPRMLSKISSTTTIAAIGVATTSAAPAVAADGPKVMAHFGVARVAGWAQAKARQHEAAAAEGPFAPLVGELDFGSGEAAFGAARSGHVHAGQDLFAPAGTPLVAVADGVVADAGSDGGQGNYVHLYDAERGLTYVYMHMVQPAAVDTGDRVSAGRRLGGVGCTGSCWGDHLHFEIRTGRGITGEPRDPLPALRDWDPLKRPR